MSDLVRPAFCATPVTSACSASVMRIMTSLESGLRLVDIVEGLTGEDVYQRYTVRKKKLYSSEKLFYSFRS